jgi:hypothetical protein
MKEIYFTLAIGGIIACPVAYLLMHKWLEGYAYRIELTPLPFVIALLTLGLLTAILIILQTIKTALANPARSLKND